MDLVSAKVEAAKLSKEKGMKVFINVDDDGECTLGKYDPKSTTLCYSNGGQIPLPTSNTEETKTSEVVKTKKKAVKKVTKKSAKKNDRKPEGKKVKIKISKAIELAKKGSSVYRASNGSPFGLYYLAKVKDKSREMELIVK